jgi:catechol 2,3-dioxygenase-like lactoylglutathione lyase family enzyme
MTGRPGLVGIHHIQVAAPRGSEDVLRRFYGDVLGMTEVPKPPDLVGRGGVWFRAGGVELHLGVEDDFRPARKAHPGLLVADLPAYVERLAARGVPVAWDGAFPGYRRCYLHDPYGNRLELLEPLPA